MYKSVGLGLPETYFGPEDLQSQTELTFLITPSVNLGDRGRWISEFKANLRNSVSKNQTRAGEMAQQIRALTALLKVLSSNHSNHMVVYNHP